MKRPKSKLSNKRLVEAFITARPLYTTQFTQRKLFEDEECELSCLPSLEYMGQVKHLSTVYDIFESDGLYHKIPASLTDTEMELDHLRFSTRGTVIKE